MVTPKKLKSLTQEQKDRIPSFAQEWADIATSCEPADRPLVEDGIQRCYNFAGIEWHGNVIWVDSPIVLALSATFGSAILESWNDEVLLNEVYKILDSSGEGIDTRSLEGLINDHVTSQISDTVAPEIVACTSSTVYAIINNVMDKIVYPAVMDEYNGETDLESAKKATYTAVIDNIEKAEYKAKLKFTPWSSYVGGSWWLGSVAWREFFRVECGLEFEDDTWDRHIAYRDANMAGWWWSHTGFTLVCDHPESIFIEETESNGWKSRVLHNEDGPCVTFRDGWKLYSWHGLSVPDWVIENPTVEKIFAEKNSEIRKAAIEVYGWPDFIKEAKLELVDANPDPHQGSLYHVPDDLIVEDNRRTDIDVSTNVIILENGTPAIDGTPILYGQLVPATCNTVQSAQAWMAGAGEGIENTEIVRRT